MRPTILLLPPPAAALVAALLALDGCARVGPPAAVTPEPVPAVARPAEPAAPAGPAPTEAPAPKRRAPSDRVAPPQVARQLGLMPLASTGIPEFRTLHPTIDGRGVLVGVLDSGVDPGVLGLQSTTTGAPKLLDLRDFSGEGAVALAPVTADGQGRIALPGGLSVGGAAAVRAAAVGGPWFGGVLEERPFGDAPAADFDGNGSNRDRYGIVVVRGPSGWLAFVDTNGDGTLADETARADFLERRETFTFTPRTAPRGKGPITAVLNLGDDPSRPGRPALAVYLDTSGHGTHVAGIIAGHDLYGVAGFDGVAPGAQLLGLRISDNARGGVSTTGSMLRAMEYAVRFAAERQLPLVLNMSFGIGNETEGTAVIDSAVDAFLQRHPDVVFTISAGNDGPGTSTIGLPASAPLALAVGAVYPGAFSAAQFGVAGRDRLGSWSARGGELAKPDLVAPGIAYSSVPDWNTGEEIKLGTSMAAPYAAGLAALLVSADVQEGRATRAAQIGQALRASGRRFEGETPADQGAGMPMIEAAYRWLAAGHAAPRIEVRALPVGPPPPAGVFRAGQVAPSGRVAGPTAAYRREGLASPADTVQSFRIVARPDADRPAAEGAVFRLASNAPWLRAVAPTVALDRNGAALVELRYDAAALARPGRYVAAVYGTPASDSTAGPLFALVNTVVVADTGEALAVSSRKAALGSAVRYYVRVPDGAAGLSVRAAVQDSATRALVFLFDPAGRPALGAEKLELGSDAPARATGIVSANDVVPGVWELVLQATPAREARYDLQARVPRVRIVGVDSSALTPSVTFAAPADTALLVTAERLGMTRLWRAALANGAPGRDTVEAPAWARQLVLDVAVPRDAWRDLTDLSVAAYDRDGAQIGQGAMNYDVLRFAVDLPERRAASYPVQVEIFPAFALEPAPARFDVRVRESFVGEPRPLQFATGAGTPPADTAEVRLGPGTGATVTIVGLRPLPPSPGWDDWIRVRAVGRRDDWAAVERLIAVHRAP
jgi:tripeptidyl-peptidase II